MSLKVLYFMLSNTQILFSTSYKSNTLFNCYVGCRVFYSVIGTRKQGRHDPMPIYTDSKISYWTLIDRLRINPIGIKFIK